MAERTWRQPPDIRRGRTSVGFLWPSARVSLLGTLFRASFLIARSAPLGVFRCFCFMLGDGIRTANSMVARRVGRSRSGFWQRWSGRIFLACIFQRGNSLETPNVWGLSSFHPNVSKQPPPPQCLGFCLLFTPRLLSRRAGSDVDATAAAHRTPKLRRCQLTTSHVDQHEEGHLQAQAGLLRQPVVRP